jgi:peptidoglycan-N-acetylglucosamine deacetylase
MFKNTFAKLLIGTSLLSSLAVSAEEVKQFPEDNLVYRPRVDIGFSQYRAPSLWGTKKVVLTFDDGPHITNTPKVLDILARYGVTATFFVLTENINPQNRHIVDRIVMEGHTLASHDHDHDNNNNESETTYKKELTQTITSIKSILSELGVNQNQIYYRFPYGAYGANRAYHHMNVMKEVSQSLFGENCINFAFWDIDTADWVSDMTSQNVADGITAHLIGGTAYTHAKKTINGRSVWRKKAYRVSRPLGGGVVLMHDVQTKSVKGVEIFLETASKKGFEIVPIESVKEFSYGDKVCELKK